MDHPQKALTGMPPADAKEETMTTAAAPADETTAPTPEEVSAAEEAGFLSSTETPTAPETETPASSTEASAPADTAETSHETVAETVPPEKMAPTELDALKLAIEERFRGVGGTLGSLQQFVNQFKASGGKKAEISRDDLKELLEEFPEFGEKALTGLNRALSKIQIGGGPAGEATGLTLEKVEEIVTQREDTREMARLTKKHNDWVQVVGLKDATTGQFPNTPYRQWLLTQPEAYRTDIENSRDADEIAESITTFKATLAPKPKEPTPKPAMTPREQQLRAAIQPRSAGGGSTGGTPQDEETAMHDAFKAEQKQRGL